jgi:hypothetical protein
MHPRFFHSRSSERRSRRDWVAFTTSGVRVSILGVTSTVRPPGVVPEGCAGADGDADIGPDCAVFSSICLAALSSCSCGNVMFTVTGTQAASPVASMASTAPQARTLERFRIEHHLIG